MRYGVEISTWLHKLLNLILRKPVSFSGLGMKSKGKKFGLKWKVSKLLVLLKPEEEAINF